MEAMATGTPVIAFDIGGIREIVEHEVTGLLVPPEDIDALQAGISRMLTDDTLHQRLSTESLKYAREHFEEERTNRTIEARFLSLLGTA
jgi:glycosyltransferase involved in cell wall biosynthesis